jgi:hypothetical protein
VAEDIVTPDKWAPPSPEGPHDHKGYSEERCVRCGWVMGDRPLNCINNDTPHRFPSQKAEIEWLRAEVERLQEWCDILANDHCECEPDMAAKGFACPYCHYRGQRGTR